MDLTFSKYDFEKNGEQITGYSICDWGSAASMRSPTRVSTLRIKHERACGCVLRTLASMLRFMFEPTGCLQT